jgi:hypothetical protein
VSTCVCLAVFVFAAGPSAATRQEPKPPLPMSEPKPAPTVRDFPAKDPLPKLVKVVDVIKGLGLDESKMQHGDEPPGKLRWLRWSNVKLPGTNAEVDVEIHVVYTLFSIKRDWDIKAVREATVLKVTITPSSRRID